MPPKPYNPWFIGGCWPEPAQPSDTEREAASATTQLPPNVKRRTRPTRRGRILYAVIQFIALVALGYWLEGRMMDALPADAGRTATEGRR